MTIELWRGGRCLRRWSPTPTAGPTRRSSTADALETGEYELLFHVGAYFASSRAASPADVPRSCARPIHRRRRRRALPRAAALHAMGLQHLSRELMRRCAELGAISDEPQSAHPHVPLTGDDAGQRARRRVDARRRPRRARWTPPPISGDAGRRRAARPAQPRSSSARISTPCPTPAGTTARSACSPASPRCRMLRERGAVAAVRRRGRRLQR